MSTIPKQQVRASLLQIQERLCNAFAAIDGGEFRRDEWQRDGGGGGITRVLEGGAVFEKGGVNFSHVHGTQLPPSATDNRPQLVGAPFEAMGVSVVMHPQNPFAPTSHANLRFFIAEPEEGDAVWWFGGGFDLTPVYGFDDDCVTWHSAAKQACDQLDEGAHARYKQWCDEYFFLPHRNEARGVGGIFFDDLNEPGFETCFGFVEAVAVAFEKAYCEIVLRRKGTAFTDAQKAFQRYRRGRYVEFNLVYDRGTLFGLQSGGRTESILMSLPPVAHWQYDATFVDESDEQRLTSHYLQPRDWLAN